MSKLYGINKLLTLVCLCGVGLSIYAYMVEVNFENNINYKPLCDISPGISCSRAFKSEYAKGLGGLIGKDTWILGFLAEKENSLFGILSYSLFATLSLSNSLFINNVLVFLFILSILMSIYFAYVLYILQTICVVCVATYVTNILGLYLSYLKKTELQHMENKMKKTN